MGMDFTDPFLLIRNFESKLQEMLTLLFQFHIFILYLAFYSFKITKETAAKKRMESLHKVIRKHLKLSSL